MRRVEDRSTPPFGEAVPRRIRRLARPVGPFLLVATAGWLISSSCDGVGPATLSPTPAVIVRISGDGQAGTAGDALAIDPTVEVRGAAGTPMPGIPVRFTVAGGGALSDTTLMTAADGRAAVGWLLGPDASIPHALIASVGAVSVTFSATAALPVKGEPYFGRNDYVEYIAGDLPLIITAPHGGSLLPDELPDRTGTNITTVRDGNTEELARTIGNVFQARTGGRPHLIIVRLRRTKIDANREIVEAAQGNRLTARAWIEYHSFIEAAKRAVIVGHGSGLYIDLHGHGHDIERLELGYLLDQEALALSDAALDVSRHEEESSIRTLSRASPASFAELLRGPRSVGGLFEAEGFSAVPSPATPNPGGSPYFNGGYNTVRHGSRDGGPISGLQIESNFTGVRDTQANRERFATALVRVWEQFSAAAARPR